MAEPSVMTWLIDFCHDTFAVFRYQLLCNKQAHNLKLKIMTNCSYVCSLDGVWRGELLSATRSRSDSPD